MTTPATPAPAFENRKKLSHAIINELSADSGVFIGRIVRSIPKTNDKGDFVQFRGDFEAIVKGQKFSSHVLFLPAIVEIDFGSMLANALSQVGTAEQFLGMDFAIEILRVKDPVGTKNPTLRGYSWSFRHLVKVELPDPLKAIRQAVEAMALPAYVAPVAENPEGAAVAPPAPAAPAKPATANPPAKKGR